MENLSNGAYTATAIGVASSEEGVLFVIPRSEATRNLDSLPERTQIRRGACPSRKTAVARDTDPSRSLP
jgi:hypothetical protein